MRPLFHKSESLGEVPLPERGLLLRWAGWFWFLIATLVMVVGLKFPSAAGFPETLQGTLFFTLLTLSHWHVLFYLLVPLLFMPLILLIPVPKLVRSFAVVLAVVTVILVVVDAFSFSIYRFHLNAMVFSLLFGGAGDEIFVFATEVYAIAAAGVVAIIALVAWFNHLAWRIANRLNGRALGYKFAMLIFFSFLGQHGWFAWAEASGNVDISSQARLYPLYMPTRAANTFRDLGWLDEEAVQRATHRNKGVVDYPKQPMSCSAEQDDKRNIFLLVIDSWRYDALSEAVTPNIHQFQQEAVSFDRHYSGGNNTRNGLFSLLYGLPATYWESFLDARVGSSLINALQDADYQLAIYASAKLTGPEFDRTIFADVKDLRKFTEAKSVIGRDQLANKEFIARLGALDDRPVFGFLFYDAPHSYIASEKYKDHFQPAAEAMNYFALNDETDPEPLLNLYRNSVISVDEMVGEAFAAIKAAGLWEESIVIVTSDHGQEFNDNGHGYWGHNGNFTDAQIRVPMMIKWPGREAETIARVTTHYDIAPTLMSEVLGCSNPYSDYSIGQPLFSTESRLPFVVGGFGNYGVRLDQQIYWVDEFGRFEVFDAANTKQKVAADPQILKQVLEQNSYFLR